MGLVTSLPDMTREFFHSRVKSSSKILVCQSERSVSSFIKAIIVLSRTVQQWFLCRFSMFRSPSRIDFRHKVEVVTYTPSEPSSTEASNGVSLAASSASTAVEDEGQFTGNLKPGNHPSYCLNAAIGTQQTLFKSEGREMVEDTGCGWSAFKDKCVRPILPEYNLQHFRGCGATQPYNCAASQVKFDRQTLCHALSLIRLAQHKSVLA